MEAAVSIKALRKKLSLTQEALAQMLGVSFASVNRWENGQVAPSPLALKKLQEIEESWEKEQKPGNKTSLDAPKVDFSANPYVVRAIVEAHRLAFAHNINPVFATEVSGIDPLPHQRIAVYEKMLPLQRLRFLLADDAGAGKTVMAGLVIREMLSRQKIRRVLIVPPAGLVGNWQSELSKLFQMPALIASGRDIRAGNPFAAPHNILIVSLDTLRTETARKLLKAPDTIPYDLVIFDEAHKLSCFQGFNSKIEKSERYRLAEMLAGADDGSEDWHLLWHPEHLLLLTATPHMGKEFPYFALWRLLEPYYFSTPEAFANISKEEKERYFIRRTKEEMVYIDGRPLYPVRISDTLGYTLIKGKNSEDQLYEETTEYLLNIYNRAIQLNQSAAKLALAVFQRRLSSSAYALKCSFERRLEKIDLLADAIMTNKISISQLAKAKKIADPFEDKTADEESCDNSGLEENEKDENEALGQIVCTALADLSAEKEHVQRLIKLAEKVLESGQEAKFNSLLEIMKDKKFKDEKILIFTEHRDTLEYLVRKLSAYGYADSISYIHGGMDWQKRQEAIAQFRKPLAEFGSRYMICTDAAAEGVNLQFCWIMINYDIPWNPARLEQRMGRIHRYGQKHDPVFLINLVAASTREGKVLKTLLEKLEKIRKQLASDKVFDSIGRVFSNISIKTYMERALLASKENNIESLTQELDGIITQEQVSAAYAKEARIFGDGGDVASKLPDIREHIIAEDYRKILPGFVEGFMGMALPLLDIGLQETSTGLYKLDLSKSPHGDEILEILEDKTFITFSRVNTNPAYWVHPGEPFFDLISQLLKQTYAGSALRGGIFIDPKARRSCLIHAALYSILHASRPIWHLAAIRQEDDKIEFCPLEEFLCINARNKESIPEDAQIISASIEDRLEKAKAFLLEHARKKAEKEIASLKADLPEKREKQIRGFNFHKKALASLRSDLSKKKREGLDADYELERVKKQMQILDKEQAKAQTRLQEELEQIKCGQVEFIAHALVLPPPLEAEWQLDNVEEMAMQVVRTYEKQFGEVFPVHTPELAEKYVGEKRPGFDILSKRKNPAGKEERRCIEVKGTKSGEYVSMTENEWRKARNMGNDYWLYIVANCGTPHPSLIKVQDPLLNVGLKQIMSGQSSFKIKISDAVKAAEAD